MQAFAAETTVSLEDIYEIDMREPCGLTLEEFTLVTEHDAELIGHNYLQGFEEKYLELEEEYGINALFLYKINGVESYWGASYLAQHQNNLGGIRYKNRLDYVSFSSWESCMDYMAGLLTNEYLTEGGSFYNGHTIQDVNKCYAIMDDGSMQINWQWSKTIGQMMADSCNYIQENS